MKLKQHPNDFDVEELTDVAPEGSGAFAFYRLEKNGWTTPDAVDVICRRWDIHPDRVAFGGLKDRHARTVQYLTIERGPMRGLRQQRIALDFLGQVPQPFRSADIRGNRFGIRLVDLSPRDTEVMLANVDHVRRDGLPNYFDDQRFGSLSGGEFIARPMIRGDFELALKLALTSPYEFDNAATKREKSILAECWGDWAKCASQLPRSHVRRIVEYLQHRAGDFRGAIGRLRPELQGMYLAAYQSYLWNAILADLLFANCPASQLLAMELRVGKLPVPRKMDATLNSFFCGMQIPLPAARSTWADDQPWSAPAKQVLAREGLAWQDLRVPGLRKPFFSRGERAAWVVPEKIQGVVSPDPRHAERSQLELSFDLPRGSYATLVVKRLTLE